MCFASLDFSMEILSGLIVTYLAALLHKLNVSFFFVFTFGRLLLVCLKDLRLATVALSWHI